MYAALYYPSLETENKKLVKNALMLWDQLQFIVPFDDWKLYSNDQEIHEALEIIGDCHTPTVDEKKLAHEGVLDLATSELPNDFLLRKCNPKNLYGVYPQKFLQETWDALKDTRLSTYRPDKDFEQWAMTGSLALAMMSILAEACAGPEIRTITDKLAAYRLTNQSIAGLHRGYVGSPDEDVDRLVTISLKIVNPARLSMRRLIKFRKREAKSGGAAIRDLRHKYLDKVDAYVKRLASVKGHEASKREIERQFEQDVKDDLENLKEALKLKASQALLSKEVLVSFLAASGVAVPPVAVPAAIIGVGALVKKAQAYRAERKAVLGEHAMSWLFELKSGPVKLY